MTPGTLSLVLRALEQGKFPTDFELSESAQLQPMLDFAHQNNRDLTMQKAKLQVGRRALRQLELQEMLIDIVSSTDHTDEEAEILFEWTKFIEDIKEAPERARNRSDAFAKLHLMRAANVKAGKVKNDFGEPEAQAVYSAFDELVRINSGRTLKRDSVPQTLRKRLFLENPNDDEVERRIFEPPTTTRAHIRGNEIKSGQVKIADWSNLRCSDTKQLLLNDPYQTKIADD